MTKFGKLEIDTLKSWQKVVPYPSVFEMVDVMHQLIRYKLLILYEEYST